MAIIRRAIEAIIVGPQLLSSAPAVGIEVVAVEGIHARRHPAQVHALGIIRERVGMIDSIHRQGNSPLPKVISALDANTVVLCFAKSGQQHSCKDGYNRNDYEQLN